MILRYRVDCIGMILRNKQLHWIEHRQMFFYIIYKLNIDLKYHFESSKWNENAQK